MRTKDRLRLRRKLRGLRYGRAPHQVHREPKVGEDDDEEDKVHDQVQHVSEELQVEHVNTLVLPATLQPGIDHGQCVFEEGADDGGGQDDIFKGEQQVHARTLLERLVHQVLQEQTVHRLWAYQTLEDVNSGHLQCHEDQAAMRRRANACALSLGQEL